MKNIISWIILGVINVGMFVWASMCIRFNLALFVYIISLGLTVVLLIIVKVAKELFEN